VTFFPLVLFLHTSVQYQTSSVVCRCEFEKNFIPYIFRYSSNGTKSEPTKEEYASVRMVERKFLR